MEWDTLLNEGGFAELLPEEYSHLAIPVREALVGFLEGLGDARQAEILQAQAGLSSSAPLEERLGVLAKSCPVLHKLGQVLGRDQRLSEELREHLRPLESLPPSIPWEAIQAELTRELGDPSSMGLELVPPAIAEASVAVVVPFQYARSPGKPQGVFKVLKPGIIDRLNEELDLLQGVGKHLEESCERLGIPQLAYQEVFQQVREKLQEEVNLEHEQERLTLARGFYANEPRVQIPEVYEFCTSKVTSMERVWGAKIADMSDSCSVRRQKLTETIAEVLLAAPMFSATGEALFHGDPHAGNLLWTSDDRLGVLDWSLVGKIEKQDRIAVVQLLLGAICHQPQWIRKNLLEMSTSENIDHSELAIVIERWLRKMRQGQIPGFSWLVGLLDDAVCQAQLRLKPDLMFFRKAYYCLEGVLCDLRSRPHLIDRVFLSEFIHHFTTEWPLRWVTSPNSREFATSLSNFDLTKAILGLPASIARYWKELANDMRLSPVLP